MKKRWIGLATIVVMLMNGILPIQAAVSTTETLAPTDALYIRGGEHSQKEYIGSILVNDVRPGYDGTNGQTRVPYLRYDLANYMDKLNEIDQITLRLSTTSSTDTSGTNIGDRSFKIYLMPQETEQWWTDSTIRKNWTTADEYGLAGNTENLLTDTSVPLNINYTFESGNLLAGIKEHLTANPEDTVITLMYELSGTNKISICNGLDANESLQPVLNITYHAPDSETVAKDAKAITFHKLSSEEINSITKNLTLPKTGENGSTITWTEESGRIDTETGAVTRPAYGEPDAEVTLKAMVSYGNATQEITFTLTILADDGIPREKKMLLVTDALYIRGGEHSEKEYIGSTLVNDIRPGYDATNGQTRVPYLRFDLADYMDALNDMEQITLHLSTTAADTASDINLGERNFKIYLMPQQAEQWWTNAAQKNWTTAEEYGLAGNTDNLIANTIVTLEGNDTLESGNLLAGIKEYLETNPSDTAITLVYELSGTKNISICNGLNADESLQPALEITCLNMDLANVLKDAEALTFDKLSSEEINCITKNLTLPKTGENGSTITWTEESGRIDTETGAVTRPVYGEPDAEVTLKAMVSFGSAMETVTFEIKILAEEQDTSGIPRATESLPATDGLYIRANENSEKEYIGGDLIDDIRYNYDSAHGATRVPYLRFDLADYIDLLEEMECITLRLTTKGVDYHTGTRKFSVYLMSQESEAWWTATDAEGNPIAKSWATAETYGIPGNKEQCLASNTVALSAEFTFESGNLLAGIKEHLRTYPEDTVITLMYELADGENLSICYGVNGNELQQPALNITYRDMDAYHAICDAEALTFDKLSPEQQDSVSKALYLPKMGENGSAITWTEESGRIDTNTGAVTRPAYGETDAVVTLTATITKGASVENVTFSVTVLADRTEPIFADKTVPASDSVYVRSDSINEGFVTEHLVVGTENGVRSAAFVKIDFSDSLDSVQNAGALYLRLMPVGGTHTGPVYIYGIDTDWTGEKLTYETAEQKNMFDGELLSGYEGELCANTYLDTDNLLEYVQRQLAAGNRTLAFRLETAGGQYIMHSAEASSDLKPRLILVDGQDAIRATLEELTLDTITDEESDCIRENLTLPQEGRYETKIVWNAEPAGIISPDGSITRPTEDTVVTLSATVSSGNLSGSKTFQVVVRRQETPEEYIDWLFDQITFPLYILAGDITLPTLSQTQITWSSADEYEMAVDGDMLRITRPKSNDLSTTLTGEISYNGTVGTRDYSFIILRDTRNDVLCGSSVASEDKTALNALDDKLTTIWESAGGQTLLLDLSISKALAALMIIPTGTGFSGLGVEISTDGYTWKTIYSGGSFQADQINNIALDTPVYGRYIRFTFPNGNYGIRMLSGYAEETTETGQTLASITLPTSVTADFTLPLSIDGEEINWVSGNPSVIRINGETAFVTRTSLDEPVTLTAQTAHETRLFQVVVKKISTNTGGSSGGGNSGGGGSTVTNHVIAQPVAQPGTSTEGTETETISSYFEDLDSVPWAVDYINALAKQGIVNGKAEGMYRPEDSLKREEFAKLMTETFGLEKMPAVTLSDVESDSWYDEYVGAVCGAGVSNGIGDGLFGIGMDITRQDAMCQLARALEAYGIQGGEYKGFADDAAIAGYAREGVYLLRCLGIVDGDENNCVNPEESISRAEIAKIIYLALEQIG